MKKRGYGFAFLRKKVLLKKRKAQAMLFGILGVLLLIAGVVLFSSNVAKSGETIADVYKKETVPIEFDPVKNYVQGCISEVAEEGLRMAGQHGGYITFEDPDINPVQLITTLDATESEGVVFSPGSGLKIPYWWYLESENDCSGSCQFASRKPDLRDTPNSIEKQLERYIQKNIESCLDGFRIFREQGFKVGSTGEPEVDVLINERDTTVLLDYPVEASKESTIRMSKYYSALDVNLDKIYSMGEILVSLEQENKFLEKLLFNMIVAFSSVNGNKLPPISETTFELASSKRWQKSDVKEKVTGMLTSYIGLIRVLGTANYQRYIFEDDVIKQRVYDMFTIPLNDFYYSDLDVSFSYLDFWPIYFDLNCNGNICGPETVTFPVFDIIGINKFIFKYDVSFPALVEIRDKKAFNGKGYDFRFFIESNLRDNKPLSTDFDPIAVSGASGATMLCDENLRNSAEVTLVVEDSVTRSRLEDVLVLYGVAGESCFIGTTDDSGTLKTRFPAGTAGGSVTLHKENYLRRYELFDAGGTPESLSLDLDPLIEKNIVLKKKKVVKSGDSWRFEDAAHDIDPNERAMITLVRESSQDTGEYITTRQIMGDDDELVKMNLAPGDYNVDIFMSNYNAIIIPEEHVHEDGGLFGEDVDYDLPGMVFDEENPFPSGGLNLNVSFTRRDLARSDTIVFYVINVDLEGVSQNNRKLEDLDQINKYDEYSGIYGSSLQPTFENR